MGLVIFPQAELTINRMDDTVRSDIESIKDAYGYNAFKCEDGEISFRHDEMESISPTEDLIVDPLKKLVQYAKEHNLSINGFVTVNSDYRDQEVYVTVHDNDLSYRNLSLINEITEDIIKELLERGDVAENLKTVSLLLSGIRDKAKQDQEFCKKVTDLVIGTDSLVEDLTAKKSNEKEHYRVSIAVHGCYRVEFPDVNASGKEKAEYVLDQYDSADFGALSEAELQDPPTAEDLEGDMSSCITTISGRFITHIEAKSPKEAYEEAFDQFENADFKELSDIDGDLVHVADDHGNYYESESELEEDEMERE